MTYVLARYIHILLALGAFIVAGALGVNTAHADTAGSNISIAANGQVIARDAKITSISGNSFVVTTGWGPSSITWTVKTTGSTKFFPVLPEGDIRSQIRVGNSVTFSGTIDPAAKFVINASSFRDTTLYKEDEIIGGIIHSIDSDNGEIILIGDTGTTTISTTSGTIVTRDGDSARLSDLIVGDKIKARGNMNTLSKVLTAGKVTYSKENRVVEAKSLGWWAALLSYFKGGETGLSVRDK